MAKSLRKRTFSKKGKKRTFSKKGKKRTFSKKGKKRTFKKSSKKIKKSRRKRKLKGGLWSSCYKCSDRCINRKSCNDCGLCAIQSFDFFDKRLSKIFFDHNYDHGIEHGDFANKMTEWLHSKGYKNLKCITKNMFEGSPNPSRYASASNLLPNRITKFLKDNAGENEFIPIVLGWNGKKTGHWLVAGKINNDVVIIESQQNPRNLPIDKRNMREYMGEKGNLKFKNAKKLGLAKPKIYWAGKGKNSGVYKDNEDGKDYFGHQRSLRYLAYCTIIRNDAPDDNTAIEHKIIPNGKDNFQIVQRFPRGRIGDSVIPGNEYKLEKKITTTTKIDNSKLCEYHHVRGKCRNGGDDCTNCKHGTHGKKGVTTTTTTTTTTKPTTSAGEIKTNNTTSAGEIKTNNTTSAGEIKTNNLLLCNACNKLKNPSKFSEIQQAKGEDRECEDCTNRKPPPLPRSHITNMNQILPITGAQPKLPVWNLYCGRCNNMMAQCNHTPGDYRCDSCKNNILNTCVCCARCDINYCQRCICLFCGENWQQHANGSICVPLYGIPKPQVWSGRGNLCQNCGLGQNEHIKINNKTCCPYTFHSVGNFS